MNIENRPILSSSVRERDIDLLIVQLVETSPPFRRWLRKQFTINTELEKFLGVSHSVQNIHGETDIEIGYETPQQNQHLLLIENKIDASFQDEQIGRYFQRGEKYIENGLCDEFSVGLIAPEDFIDENSRDSFDTVVSYEDIVTQLKTLSHDGVPFFAKLFELALDKQGGDDNTYPDLAHRIESRFFDRQEEFPEITPYNTTNNLVRFRSTHSDHPSTVTYSVWVRGDNHGKQTMVRLSIDSDAPEGEIQRLQSLIADNFHNIHGFELMEDSTMYTVRTHVGEEVTDDDYADKIVSTLRDLVTHYYPKMIVN